MVGHARVELELHAFLLQLAQCGRALEIKRDVLGDLELQQLGRQVAVPQRVADVFQQRLIAQLSRKKVDADAGERESRRAPRRRLLASGADDPPADLGRDCTGGKRLLMGEAAGRGSDFVVLTSDNPRSEDPLKIIQDALAGLQNSGTRYSVEPDRRKAIALAIDEATSGDIVLIAGKGHEKFQVTREGAFPFDDVKVAREALQHMGYLNAAEGARR